MKPKIVEPLPPVPMTFTTHAGQCKLCRQPLSLEIHDLCPVQNLTAWISMATCNRCFDYIDRCSLLFTRIDHAARVLQPLSYVDDTNDEAVERANLIRDRIRLKLAKLTKLLADLVCKHYRKPTFWEPDFVDQLMEKPMLSRKICAVYVRMVKGQR